LPFISKAASKTKRESEKLLEQQTDLYFIRHITDAVEPSLALMRAVELTALQSRVFFSSLLLSLVLYKEPRCCTIMQF
jgi:hypothetical protein